MKHYTIPDMSRKKGENRRSIPDCQFAVTVAEMNREILREMRENEIRETQSARFASNFTITLPFRDK